MNHGYVPASLVLRSCVKGYNIGTQNGLLSMPLDARTGHV